MTHSAILNQIRELAERFRADAGATEMPEYAELLSATASDLEQHAAHLEMQRTVNPQWAVARNVSAHARFAACTFQAA
jgi:hypothetical protein